MTRPLILLLLCLAVAACKPAGNLSQTSPVNHMPKDSLYDQEFMNALDGCGGRVEWAGNQVLYNGDTVLFPLMPFLNHEHVLKSSNNGDSYVLRLQRRRLNSVYYSLTQTTKSQVSVTRESKAYMATCFFQGQAAEAMKKSVVEFTDKSAGCPVVIVIQGNRPGHLKASLRYGCDSNTEINFQEATP